MSEEHLQHSLGFRAPEYKSDKRAARAYDKAVSNRFYHLTTVGQLDNVLDNVTDEINTTFIR